MKKSISIILAILMCFSCFSMISFAEEAESEHITTVPEGYVGIYTKDDLFAVRENPSGKYILMNNIVFNASDYENGGDFYNSGKGWEPIGTSSTPFSGSFNGNKYAIINLQINNPKKDYQGLFGCTSGATIKGVNLQDVHIVGGNYIGGVVGYDSYTTTLSDCYCDGYISGNSYVGGMIGYTSYGNITNCINSAQIFGVNDVGGISGLAYALAISGLQNVTQYYHVYIKNCINSGIIVCSETTAGGIVGNTKYVEDNPYNVYANIYIQNCYNVGNISAKKYAGGILGCDTRQTIVQYSYSIGNVTAETNYGGCFGKTPYNRIFCYYLEDAVTDADCLTGIAKSADQLRKKGTFEQWDFDTIWTMDGREDYPYPELRDVPLIFPDELNHEHEYSSEITTPATHLTEGLMTYTCSCGDTYTESIAKTTEHTYSTIVTEPTCTDRGFTLYFCACNDFYMADYVEANGHSHNAAITTPATHLTEGVMTYTCACGDAYTEAIAKTTEHTYSAVVTPPTCTAQGYTTYTCVCGDTYVSDYVKENGHAHTATVTTPATHLTEGLMTYTCACGDTYTEAIAKTTTHTFTEEILATPTCTAKGEKLFTCECGYTYTEEIAKTNHINTNGDFACDICGNNLCSHMCHKSGFMGFIWKLINFFSKLFGTNPVCECGVAHY